MRVLDRAEEIVAEQRLSRWSEDERRWFDELPSNEQDVVRMMLAHLDARPTDVVRVMEAT